MTVHDQYAAWTERRRQPDVPEGFSRRVMESIERKQRRPVSRWLGALALAAGVLLVALFQATTVTAMLVALGGVAQ
jgi:hypothetical protein